MLTGSVSKATHMHNLSINLEIFPVAQTFWKVCCRIALWGSYATPLYLSTMQTIIYIAAIQMHANGCVIIFV